jgi:glycosyltransferase involved in cell wall biosynthesis
LDSVLAQTFTDWEAICVDDGSTDGSGAILDEYAAKDKRFRVIHQANAGVSAARNKALDEIKGGWVGFLDGDDFLNIDFFKEAAFIVDKENPEIIRFRFEQFEDKIFNQDNKRQFYRIIEGDLLTEWVMNTIPYEGYACICVIKKDFVVRYQEDVRVAEDTLFMMQTAVKVKKIVQSEFVSYYYRIVQNSATRGKFSSRERLAFFKKFSQVAKFYPDKGRSISRMGWLNLIWWILSPRDTLFSAEIYDEFMELVKNRCICVRDLKPHVRLAFIMYCFTAWHWPIKCTYKLTNGLAIFLAKVFGNKGG